MELFKHCLYHPIARFLWVQWRLREQHRMLVWLHPQFIVERVVPHLQSAEEEEVRETVCVRAQPNQVWLTFCMSFQSVTTPFSTGCLSDSSDRFACASEPTNASLCTNAAAAPSASGREGGKYTANKAAAAVSSSQAGGSFGSDAVGESLFVCTWPAN